MGRALTILSCAALGSASGCYQGIPGNGPGGGQGDGTDGADAGDDESGDAGSEGPGALDDEDQIAARDLKRLSRYEYINTLRALFPQDVVDAVSVSLQLLPEEGGIGKFDTVAQDITEAHVSAYAKVATVVAHAVMDSPSARAQIVPCFDAGAGRACVETMVEEFGPRLLRRPISARDIDDSVALYDDTVAGGDSEAFVAVLASLLQSPDFIFKLEVAGEETEAPDVFTLSDHELANRLAYYAWGAPPDDTLREAADAGALPDELSAQLERMLADDRARAHLRHYYGQWLLLDRFYPSPDVENVPEWVAPPEAVQGLNEAMKAEIVGLVDWVLWDEGGSFADLMTTDAAFITEPNLAAIYGVATGTEDDPMITIDDGSRNGLLSRLQFAAYSGGTSTPIHRGNLVLRQLVCQELALPDASILEDTDGADLDPTTSTRVGIEALTAAAECQACHHLINPLGFAMEDLDGLGRLRTTELVTDGDGVPTAEVAVDASVTLQLDPGQPTQVDGTVELGAALANSETANRCAAKQWLRFQGGTELTGEHTELVDNMTEALTAQDGGLVPMIQGFALRDAFAVRRVEY